MYVQQAPPHDVDAEEAVIGSLLISGDAITEVLSFLKPADFFLEKNRWCYEACLALFDRGEAINQITVAHQLGLQGHLEEMGGSSYLSHLVTVVPTSIHLQYYGRIVHRTAIMRRLIDTASRIAEIGYEGAADVDVALGKAEELLFRIRSAQPGREFLHIKQVLDKYMEDTSEEPGSLGKGLLSIPTGFVDLDKLLGGLQRSDLVILAGRPGLGKSTLAMNIAQYAAAQGALTGVFSLEMSAEQLALRLLASEAQVDSQRLRRGGPFSETQESRIMDSIGHLSDLPIYIDDTPLQTIVEMRGKSRRLQIERSLDLLIVDYIQLIRGNSTRSDNRVQEMSEISRSLKALARDLDIPVLACSQLSRAVEQRPGHRPQLSDLRESGSIEQDADIVAFIYRDDAYYTEEQWAHEFPDKPYPKNIADIIVAKHRHGPVDTINLYFRQELAHFENYARGMSG